jgi:HPt (histidine-containing phosphotransfer) domain-containing protein
MDDDRFPYETTRWKPAAPEQLRRWYEELEKLSPADVRARLAHFNAGSAGSISIGAEQNVTIGFIQEWLAWHDQRAAEREANFRNRQIFWTRWAALAATLAACAAVIGWAITVYMQN